MPALTPPLLTLPLELRQQIYHNLLAPTLATHHLPITLVQRPSTTTYTLHGLSPISSLISTCSTLSTEILLYTFTHFTFHLLPAPSSTPHLTVRDFYRKIGARNRQLVKNIVLPEFSVESVVRDPAGMVAVFAGQAVRRWRVVEELQAMFLGLGRFAGLSEVEVGVHVGEVVRGEGMGWWRDRGRMRGMGGGGGKEMEFISGVMIALEDAKVLSQTVTLGIWWKQSTSLDGLSGAEVEDVKMAILRQLKEAVAPVQVVCRGTL